MTDKQTQFEYWLIDMDDALARFFNSLPENVRTTLNYSIESLDAIEQLILATYKNSDEMLAPEATRMLDGFARYIGETIRKNIGGHWGIELADPKYVYHGLPQLTGFAEKSTPECPISLATATAARRKGNYLSTIVRNMAKRYKK
jgi:hypothetical protein